MTYLFFLSLVMLSLMRGCHAHKMYVLSMIHSLLKGYCHIRLRSMFILQYFLLLLLNFGAKLVANDLPRKKKPNIRMPIFTYTLKHGSNRLHQDELFSQSIQHLRH